MAGGRLWPHMREVGGSSPSSSPTVPDPPPCLSPKLPMPGWPLARGRIWRNFVGPLDPRPPRRDDHDAYALPFDGHRSGRLRRRPGLPRTPVPLADARAGELRAVHGLLALAG